MPRPKKPSSPRPILDDAEKVSAALEGFDYGVDARDFVLYELHRLIEEERADVDNPEFRLLIDEGIRAHIEENLEIRAKLAGILRSPAVLAQAPTIALRVVHALEDLEADLCNAVVLVRSYTAYLLSRLESLAENAPSDAEDRIASAADLLFDSAGDRDAAETALTVLCGTPSPVSARILAHAVSEPLLDEDLETRAFAALKELWPLPRHYMHYNLKDHPHEDIPVRWFQLFVDVDELTSVELVLEELRAHGDNPEHQEDLVVLLEALHGCRDPELEDKILGVLNASSTGLLIRSLLSRFLEEHHPPEGSPASTPWTEREQALELNRRYIEAAWLWESGRMEAAIGALDAILVTSPDYPFARVLKNTVRLG